MNKDAKCQMTMGQYGNSFECGKPAKFTIADRLRGKIRICGLHARAYAKTSYRIERQYGIKRQLPKLLNHPQTP